MAAAVADEDCLMIAISLSGNTQTITEAIRIAKAESGSRTVTANREAEIDCDVCIIYGNFQKSGSGNRNFAPISYSGTDGYFLWILF